MGGDVYIVTSQYKTSCTTVNSHPHVHCIPQNGCTALWQASFDGHHKVVDLLTNAGAVVDVQDEVLVSTIKIVTYTMECDFTLANYSKLSLHQYSYINRYPQSCLVMMYCWYTSLLVITICIECVYQH